MDQTSKHTQRNNIIAVAIIFAMAVGVAIAYLSVVRPTHNDVLTAETEQKAEKAVRKDSALSDEGTVSPEQEISNRYLAGEITYDEMHEARAELKRKRRAAELQAYLDQDLEYDTINGIEVPPEPPEALNNRTIAGLDHNANGIRDDVDRELARRHGDNEKMPEMYEVAVTGLRYIQHVMVSGGWENAKAKALNKEFSIALYCDGVSLRPYAKTSPILKELSSDEEILVNTYARGQAYGLGLAGSGGKTPTEEECAAAAQR